MPINNPVAATKEFSVPMTIPTGGATGGGYDQFGGILLNDVDESARVSFHIPHDFSSITEAVLMVIPFATQAAANWDIFSSYAAKGEPRNTHAESDVASTYNVTNGELFEVDISGILSALSAGDYVGIRVQQKTAGHNVVACAVRFEYS